MKLMVLEDGGDFARVLGSVLRGAGIEVVHCSDGAGVRAELVRKPPDVMLIDADTRGQIGLDILRDIRRNPVGAHIPVILTSAIYFEQEEPIQRASTECDVNRFMRRPIQVLDLERVIQEASRHRPSARIPISRQRGSGSQEGSGEDSASASSWGPGRHGEVPEYQEVRSRASLSMRSQPQPKKRARPTGKPSIGQVMRKPNRATDAMLTLRRLRKETRHLQVADDWTVLSIPRCRDLDRIEIARQRMAVRYANIAKNDGYSEEIHEMARAIGQRVEQAAATLSARIARALKAAAVPPPSVEDEEPDEYALDPQNFVDQIFQRGQTALAAGDVHSAIRYLRQARNEDLGSARNMAWLGWAQYQDSSRSRSERRDAAMELLELADQFDSGLLDGQFFLATVESDCSLHERAAARLRRLLKTRKSHLGARRLYEHVQASLAQAQVEIIDD
jgi:CheY-like chemotaxis protein